MKNKMKLVVLTRKLMRMKKLTRMRKLMVSMRLQGGIMANLTEISDKCNNELKNNECDICG
jgi:hypothetical protein